LLSPSPSCRKSHLHLWLGKVERGCWVSLGGFELFDAFDRYHQGLFRTPTFASKLGAVDELCFWGT
jgi:hypothetical protein